MGIVTRLPPTTARKLAPVGQIGLSPCNLAFAQDAASSSAPGVDRGCARRISSVIVNTINCTMPALKVGSVVFPIAQLLGAKRLTGISCDLASIAQTVAKYLAVADLIAVSSVLRTFPASYAFVPFGHV